MEKKYFNAPFFIEDIYEVKQGEESNGNYGIIKGYASTFGNLDLGNDRIKKGAFKKTLKKYRDNGRQIRMFFQHDFRNVIGGFTVYKEKADGLYVEGQINLDVQKGAEAYSLAKQGVLTDFSIGYFPKKVEWDEEINGKEKITVRNIEEIDLYEISLVSNPMNEQAMVTDIKSMNIRDISKLLKEKGFSNKEANEIIYQVKSSRNDDDSENNDPIDKDDARNDAIKKIDEILLSNKISQVISKIKERA